MTRRNAMAAGLAGGVALAVPGRLEAATRGGFSPAGLAKIPPMLQRYVEQDVAVGIATLIYRRGEIEQVNLLGYQDREANVPMRRDTIFRIASMTKPITCVAALTLVDQGRIGLFESVDKWLPELADPKVLNRHDGPLTDTRPAARGITLADLLTHRSGIAGQAAEGPLLAALGGLRADDPTFDEWLKRLGQIPLAYDPGSTWLYGTSHDVLGALVQRVSGKSFPAYLQDTIFNPLGMKDTGFWLPASKQGRLAALYGFDSTTGKRAPIPRPLPSSPRNFVSGAGGLVSTMDDYLRFARMLLHQGRDGEARILSRPTVTLMTSNWLTPEQRRLPAMGVPDMWASRGFGLGVDVIDNVARLGTQPYAGPGSFSWGGATGVSWRADPKEDMVWIYMVQNTAETNGSTRPAGVPASTRPLYAPLAAFSNLIYSAIES